MKVAIVLALCLAYAAGTCVDDCVNMSGDWALSASEKAELEAFEKEYPMSESEKAEMADMDKKWCTEECAKPQPGSGSGKKRQAPAPLKQCVHDCVTMTGDWSMSPSDKAEWEAFLKDMTDSEKAEMLVEDKKWCKEECARPFSGSGEPSGEPARRKRNATEGNCVNDCINETGDWALTDADKEEMAAEDQKWCAEECAKPPPSGELPAGAAKKREQGENCVSDCVNMTGDWALTDAENAEWEEEEKKWCAEECAKPPPAAGGAAKKRRSMH